MGVREEGGRGVGGSMDEEGREVCMVKKGGEREGGSEGGSEGGMEGRRDVRR